jgi:hypothetical protein
MAKAKPAVSARPARKMWALLRDGQIYVVRPTYDAVRHELALYRPGTKHTWRCERVVVSFT